MSSAAGEERREALYRSLAPTTDATRARRIADVLAAGTLLMLSAPIILTAALAVLATSGRPAFYGHRRAGRGGRPFRCWKLRTMTQGADRQLETDPELRRRYVENDYKLPANADPRVNRLGRWLRRTHLDELPQLFNVLNGTMSLVGPRPVVAEELQEFDPDADELLAVRPGIFGAWNSLGRRRPGYPERSRIELEYVRTQTLGTDLRILLRSVPVVLTGADPEA